jgi:hypothetical protein
VRGGARAATSYGAITTIEGRERSACSRRSAGFWVLRDHVGRVRINTSCHIYIVGVIAADADPDAGSFALDESPSDLMKQGR